MFSDKEISQVRAKAQETHHEVTVYHSMDGEYKLCWYKIHEINREPQTGYTAASTEQAIKICENLKPWYKLQ